MASTALLVPQSPPRLPQLWDPDGCALPVPAPLSGAAGKNRAPGVNALGVADDLAAVRMFLHEYQRSPATLRSYTKETERLLLWAHVARGRALSDLDRGDFAAYSAFLADPQPQELWCAPRRGRNATRASPTWRPFVGPLGLQAQRTALIIVHTLLSYLVKAGYLVANPLALMRRQAPDQGLTLEPGFRVRERVFDDVQWQALLQTLQQPNPDDFACALDAARTRFMVALMHFLALRVGELTSHTMGHFRAHQGRWVFFVVGKGRKAAEVPVNDALLAELKRFRLSLGLQPYPLPEEPTPLVAHHGRTQALSARRINQIVTALMDRAALRLGPKDAGRAMHMRSASAHWFRHTSLTRQAQAGLDLTHIKANARHARLDTTMIYIHTEHKARHAAMQKHTWGEAPAP